MDLGEMGKEYFVLWFDPMECEDLVVGSVEKVWVNGEVAVGLPPVGKKKGLDSTI